MATDRPRFSISLDDETLERVERFRFEQQLSTRSKAIERLVWGGLASSGAGQESAPPLSGEALEIAAAFEAANSTSKEIARLALNVSRK